MNNATTYEQELDTHGFLIYTTAGCSMRPFLRSGEDLVCIERKSPDRCRKYDAILYRRDNGRYVLHRVVKVRPDSYTLCGDNCWSLEPGICEDQVLGVLTGVIRKGRKIDVNRWQYRLAVRIWCALYLPRAAFLYLRGKVWALWKKIKAAEDPS